MVLNCLVRDTLGPWLLAVLYSDVYTIFESERHLWFREYIKGELVYSTLKASKFTIIPFPVASRFLSEMQATTRLPQS